MAYDKTDPRLLAVLLKQAFLSQAVGDALGEEFEFGTPSFKQFKEKYSGSDRLFITDDTQMALFGLTGIQAALKEHPTTLSDMLAHVEHHYKTWLVTQCDWRRDARAYLEGHSLNSPEMRQRRAPGNTCLSALESLADGEAVINDSKGNGAVMRTLPFVFTPWMLDLSFPEAIELAVSAGKITHHHEESSIAVRAYMNVGLRVLEDAVNGTKPRVSTWIANTLVAFPEIDQWIKHRHTNMWPLDEDDFNTFTALPALVHAFAALLAYEGDYERVVKSCVVARGDSDTVAAIAMGLHGLAYSAPDRLVQRLEEARIIRKVCGVFAGGVDVCQSVQVEGG